MHVLDIFQGCGIWERFSELWQGLRVLEQERSGGRRRLERADSFEKNFYVESPSEVAMTEAGGLPLQKGDHGRRPRRARAGRRVLGCRVSRLVVLPHLAWRKDTFFVKNQILDSFLAL